MNASKEFSLYPLRNSSSQMAGKWKNKEGERELKLPIHSLKLNFQAAITKHF